MRIRTDRKFTYRENLVDDVVEVEYEVETDVTVR